MDRNNSPHRDGLSLRSSDSKPAATTSSDFILQWGNRKRLRCMKSQAKDGGTHNNDSRPGQRAAARIERRAVRSDLNDHNNKDNSNLFQANTKNTSNDNNGGGKSNASGYVNLRHRTASPSHRILRNSETSISMKAHSNGVRGLTSPDRADKKSGANNKRNNQNDHRHHNGGGSGSSETATHDGKKGGSPSAGETIAAVWPPKFVIALTNKEKEEDFLVIKGSKLPQRPKKRAKIIQRTVNLVCPGTWLCDLTLERYEVREKKVSKKRPRGLKAMSNMDSESE